MEMSCHNINGKIPIINISSIPVFFQEFLFSHKYSHFDFLNRVVAKIQEQIVIAEEIMGDTQTCVFFFSLSFSPKERPNVQNVIIANRR